MQGFTLVELLIVIALLGALAVGLLVTINPVEQIAKGRDTTMRNTARSFFDASVRYYSTRSTYPWGTYLANTTVNSQTAAFTTLVNAGEVKSNFVNLAGTANLALMYVTQTASDQIAVCFKPTSKGIQADPNTIYDQSAGTSIANCKGATSTGTADCYVCIQ